MSERGFEPLVNTLPFAAIVLDTTGSILHVNSRAARMVRREAAELAGKSFFSCLPFSEGGTDAGARYRESAVHGSLSFFFVTELRATDDTPPIALRIHLSCFRHSSNLYGLALFEPMTGDEQLHRQIQTLEECLNTVDEIRHEINNMLMGLLGNSELLQGYGLQELARERVDLIMNQGRRMRERLVGLSAAIKLDRHD